MERYPTGAPVHPSDAELTHRAPHPVTPFRLTTVAATFQPLAAWKLPTHPEVMMRGALGARLFDLVCRRDDRDCRACEHRADCPVSTWWDPGRAGGHSARPFVPSVALGGRAAVGPQRPWTLHLALLSPPPRPGLLIDMLRAAATGGLGSDRVPHTLSRVEVRGETQVVWAKGDETADAWPEPGEAPRPPVDLDRLAALHVHLRTPWRWQPRGGRRGQGPPTAQDLVRAAWQRVRPVQRAQGLLVGFPRWPDPTGLPGHWLHYGYQQVFVQSTRQGARLDLSGHRGVMVLGPQIRPWATLLAAVSAINVGRQSSYGLGRFELEWVVR